MPGLKATATKQGLAPPPSCSALLQECCSGVLQVCTASHPLACRRAHVASELPGAKVVRKSPQLGGKREAPNAPGCAIHVFFRTSSYDVAHAEPRSR